MSDNIFRNYTARIDSALKHVNIDELESAIKIILNTSQNGGYIWLTGNGGSAATSSHFATDLSRCTAEDGKHIKAISLCDNLGLITSIGNDFSFEDIFVNQLKNLGKELDLLISISASGNSKNLIKAVEFANVHSISTLSLVGFDGGALQQISDNSIYVPTNIGDYGVAEDCHLIICHYISTQLRK
jgi:D-sedoheptulose 7-phosphate isomerase